MILAFSHKAGAPSETQHAFGPLRPTCGQLTINSNGAVRSHLSSVMFKSLIFLCLFLMALSMAPIKRQLGQSLRFSVKKTLSSNICLASFGIQTIYHQRHKADQQNISYTDHMQQLSRVNALIKQRDERAPIFAQETDIRRHEWLYTFALYNGYSYCKTAKETARFALPSKDVQGQLPTGKFVLSDWQEFNAYNGSYRKVDDLDGHFYVAVDHKAAIIVLNWRGSKKVNDFIADADGRLSGMHNQSAIPYIDKGHFKKECAIPADQTDLFYFEGFMDTMQQDTLDRVLAALYKARRTNPSYSIIINGHSLGGAKAMLTAFYLAKFHSTTLPLAAVYTYGQPPVGSTKFNTWISNCIGPQKIVRVVASTDVIPWSRVALNVNHPENVIEVYNYDSNQNLWRQCIGPDDSRCSAGVNCLRRGWKHHSRYGGLYLSGKLCHYGQGA